MESIMEHADVVVGLLLKIPYVPKVAFAAYLLFGLTYIFYCAIIKIATVWQDLHIVIKVMVLPFAIVGVLLDVLVNVFIGTALSLVDLRLELPKEWLFTRRLQRWREGTGRRRVVAIWLCEEGLNPIDPNHC